MGFEVTAARHRHAVAWTLFNFYEIGVWPVLTFLTGLEDVGLELSLIAAVPIWGVLYASERRDRRREKKLVSAWRSAVGATMTILLPLLGFYCVGAIIGYFTGAGCFGSFSQDCSITTVIF